MCFFVRVNQPYVDPGYGAMICGVIKAVLIGAAATGFIAASIYSDDQSSIVFRLAKPIIIDSWKALQKIGTDPRFYNPLIKILAWGLGIVAVFLFFQLGALKVCFNETACIFDWIPSSWKAPCLGFVGCLSGGDGDNNNLQNGQYNTQNLIYPRQGSAVRRSMNRRNQLRQNDRRREESEDGGNDTSFSYLQEPVAPGVVTIQNTTQRGNSRNIYPQVMPEKSIEFI